MLVTAVIRPAHLDDLEESLVLAQRLPLRQNDQAVNDREQGIALVVGGRVLAEKKPGGFPGHQVDGDLVAELSKLLPGRRQIVEDLEAVDDDDGRLDLLDVLHDERSDGFEPFRSQR